MELLHRRCCGLDVHKETVVACLRLVSDGKVTTEVRTFQTTTAGLLRLSEWLAINGCTHVAMEATGVYWKPVWHILDDGEFELVLANAAHVKNVPGRKTDVSDAMWLGDQAPSFPAAPSSQSDRRSPSRHGDDRCASGGEP
jgi:transposase